MRKFYRAMLDELSGLHAEIVKAIDELPPEALDWVPGSDMNSLSVLAVHTTGAERFWIGDVVKGDPSFRNRDAEFRVQGMTAEALKQRIADLDLYEAAAFETLSLRDLDGMRVNPRDGKQVSVAWALLHPLQHTGQHVGHIEILKQQWMQSHNS
jgi:uncharacterized damage-inducible protein DinB